MKKILLLFALCALLPRVAGAQGTPTDDTFTVSDLTFSKDNIYSFIVGVSGSEKYYTACNLDLDLPSGLTIAQNSQGKYRISIIQSGDAHVYPSTEVEDGEDEDGEPIYKTVYPHSLSFAVTNEGKSARIAIIDLHSNLPFTKTSGQLFRVYVTLDASAFTSSFSPKPIVTLSGLNLTALENGAAKKYVPANFSCRPFTTGIPTNRTLNVTATNKVGTLILPFDAEQPEGLKAYTCNGADGDLLTLTPAASIEACKPYIVYAEGGYSGTLSGTATLSDDSNVDDIFADGYLTGTLSATTVNTGYILQNQGSGPMFYDAEGVTFSLPAGRCYLTPPTNSVKSFTFNFGGEDGVEDALDVQPTTQNYYDLSGRQVTSPARGLYIQGTRKVLIK